MIALALPFFFLHDQYQPFDFAIGGGIEVWPYDLAAAAVVIAALVWARRYGLGPLRAGRPLWLAGGAFIGLCVAACFYPLLRDRSYDWATYAVTAAKFFEYMLLAPALVLLVRRRADLEAVIGALVAWSCAMSAVGVLQFVGLVDELEGRRPGQREPAYVGIHDFAALSTAALAVGLVLVALGMPTPRERVAGIAATVAGTIGLVLSGSVAAAGGLVVAAVAVAAVARARRTLTVRRAATVAGVTAVACLGVLALRGSDLDQFARFLGIRPAEESTVTEVQSYSQRTVLVYIGFRIWLDHPVLGAGFQASAKDVPTFTPYLDDARRRFPGTAEEAFPSAEHPWGVQNFYVQALADLGVVGLALWLATLAAGLWLAVRAALRRSAAAGAVAGAWLVVAAAIWSARGILAGLPLDALTWLAAGLAVRAQEELRD